MATFHAGPQTHQRMLPQFAALESVGADTPEGGHETAHGRAAGRAPDVEAGRGEIRRSAPDGGRHPDPEQSGKGGRVLTDPYVFVLDRDGKPLQPCRPGRARQFLKAGRAVVVRHTPFVIRLTDRTAADSTVAGCRSASTPAPSTPASPSSPNGAATAPENTVFNSTTGARRSATSSPPAPTTGAAEGRASCATALLDSSTAPNPKAGSRHPCGTAWTPPCRGWPG